MASITKKICLIGDFAVGKSSLVSRYVHNVFSDKYLTTVGVRIDTKEILLPHSCSIKLVIWDIAGSDRFSTTETHYLRGAAGYLLVVDSTRRNTLQSALQLKQSADRTLNSPPFVVVFNKTDLRDQWEISNQDLRLFKEKGWKVLKSSAKKGENVEHAFQLIATSVLR